MKCTVLSLVLLAVSAPAQETVWQVAGTGGFSRVGSFPTAACGDIDGDGYRDLASLVDVYLANIPLSDVQVWILSGRDGHVLRTLPGDTTGYRFERIDGAGDVDRDGTEDYVVAVFDRFPGVRDALVQVRSGRDDHVIWQARNAWGTSMGTSVLGNLDLNGDGRKDVVVSAPTETTDGVIYAFDHQGRLLHRLAGTPQLTFGASSGPQTLGRVGDLDGDGDDDFAVGGFDRTAGQAVVIVFSGRTGQILVMGRDERRGDGIGWSVSGCGDLDGDGVPDFIAGNSPAFQEGVVCAYTGRTGALLRSWRSSTYGTCFSGETILGPGDVDLDGVPDVVTANLGCGSYWVFSGRDGSTIFAGLNQSGLLGSDLATVGRQPDSPYPHFVITQPAWQFVGFPFQERGRILDVRMSPPGAEIFGLMCGATPPRIGARNLGAQGVRVTLHGAPVGAPTALLMGLSRTQWSGNVLPYPLTALGLPGCSLYVAPDLALVIDTGHGGVAAGYAQIDVPLPLNATSSNQLFAQWMSFGLSGLAVSDAVGWRY